MGIHLAAKHALELERPHAGLEFWAVAFDVVRRGLVVLVLGELEQFQRGAHRTGDAIHLSELSAQASAFPTQLLGALGLAPHRLVFQLQADFL